MLRYLTCIILFLLPGLVNGEEISVKLFSKTHPSTFIFTPSTGTWKIICNGQESISVNPGEPVIISKYESKVLYKTLDGVSRLTDTLKIVPDNTDNIFTVRQPS